MKTVLVCSLVLGALGAYASDPCTFSAEHQAHVRALALAKYPGGSENPKTHDLIWASERLVVQFGYGGCHDLGSVAGEDSLASQPLSEQQVFAKARQLAERFWTKDLVGGNSIAIAALTEGLDRRRFEVTTIRGTTQYVIRHKSFVELYVTHTYKDGWNSVSVGWQANE